MTLNLLSESQSAELAGVSPQTLQQYREFGLLKAVWQGDSAYYSESEIRSIFFTKNKTAIPNEFSAVESNEKIMTQDSNSQLFENQSNIKVANSSAQINNEGLLKSDEKVLSIQEHFKASKPTTFTTQPSPSSQPPPNFQALKQENPHLTTVEDILSDKVKIKTEEAENKKEVVNNDSSTISSLLHQSQVANTELIETNKNLREQLEIVREERNWLRARIEKLEARSEREQMLILAESENVRNLINQKKQKSLLSLALPWLGFSSEENLQEKGEKK